MICPLPSSLFSLLPPPPLSIGFCNVCYSYTVDLMHNVGSLYENGTDFNPADEWAAKYQVKEEKNATVLLTSNPEEGCVSLHFAGMKLIHGFLAFNSRSPIALKSFFVYLMNSLSLQYIRHDWEEPQVWDCLLVCSKEIICFLLTIPVACAPDNLARRDN